jgi:2-C-methyl-D-erythritol 2,4-cyclodiphosphate synthase
MKEYRVGSGFDVHRLKEGVPLWLGGVRLDHPRGLEGHSDGDCLLHAVCDALLGAAAAGDMGTHFPSRDPRWKGAPSLRFLERVAEIVRASGYDPVQVDATVVAEEPALASHLSAMRARVAETLALPPGAVSVKAKSTDGLGAIGRGEGIAAFATVLVRGAHRESE